MKRSEKKKRSKSQDIHVNAEPDKTINLISDDEMVSNPPRNSMQIKRWKNMLSQLHSKSQITECKGISISRSRETSNVEQLKLDETILKVRISVM